MKSYLKLVNFEVNRFFKLYLILMGLTIICQIVGAFTLPMLYMNYAKQTIYENQMSTSQYIEEYGDFSFSNYLNSGWFLLPIFFCIALLMIYVFLIWYRDWFGKNTFMYRLLILPANRVNIYLAKLTTIMMLVLGMIALQLLLLPIEIRIINSIVEEEFRTNFLFSEIDNSPIFYWLYPITFTDFMIIYGLGLIFVAVVFTAILFERSYRLKGIFFAIVYIVISFAIFISPLFMDALFKNYFYPLEIISMALVTTIIVLGLAFWIANHLLKHKIKV